MAGTGIVARVAGVVVDAEFASGDLPSIHNALVVQHDDGPDLLIEVQAWTRSEVRPDLVLGRVEGRC